MTYSTAVRSFDHGWLTRYPAYFTVLRALNELAHQAHADDDGPETLADWLAAAQDMAVTLPYADNCSVCSTACLDHDPAECGYCGYKPNFPYRVERDGNWLHGSYCCPGGHKWTCGYSVEAAYMY